MRTRIGGSTNASKGRKVAAKINTRDEKPDEPKGKREAKARRVARGTDFFESSGSLVRLNPHSLTVRSMYLCAPLYTLLFVFFLFEIHIPVRGKGVS